MIVLVALTAPYQISAQSNLSIFGTVTDTNGNSIKDVEVTAFSGQFKAVKKTETNGLYQFFGLPDGVYTLTFEAKGFWGGERLNVVVRAGQPAQENKQLRLNPPRRTRIAGQVQDPSGAASPGILVSATNLATRATYSTITDAQGEYSLEPEPGEYQIKFEAGGFKTIIQENVQIAFNMRVRVDATLDVAGVSSTVNVDVTTSATSTDAAHTILQLPVDSRNFFNLLNLQPGVTRESSINGLRGDKAVITVDGMSTNSMPGTSTPPVSAGSIGEFRFSQTGAISPAGFQSVQLSKSSGDAIDVSTRSGNNDFRGEVDYQVMNDAFDARNFFNLPGFDTFRKNDFSAKLGGPIRKDTLFFFVNYDLNRTTEAPTFSRILSSRIFELNQQLRRLGLPEENLRRFVATSASDSPLVRLDYRSEKHSFAIIYSFRRNFNSKNLMGTMNGASPASSTARDITDRHHLFSLRYFWTISPLIASESSYVYRSNSILIVPVAPAEPSMLIPGLTLLGRATSLTDGDGHKNVSHLLSEKLTIAHGSHSLSFGGHFDFNKNLFRFAAFESGRAVFPDLAALSANVPVVDLFQLGTGGSQVRFDLPKAVAYFQDDIRVGSNLSVNLALRYKAEFPPSTVRKETQGWQPKIGFAWDIQGNGDTVLRGGYTLYRSFLPQLPLAFQLLIGGQGLQSVAPPRRVISIAGQQAASSAFNQFLTGGNVPNGPQMAVTYNPHSRSPMVHALDVSLTRSLKRNLAFDISYGFRLGRHLLTSTNINLPAPVLINGRPDFRNATLNPAFTQIYQFETTGESNYHSGSVNVFRHFSNGFGFNAGYTFSKAIDDVPSLERVDTMPMGSFEATPENVFDRRRERAVSSWNPTHKLRAWAVWEIPDAQGPKASRLRRALGTLFFSEGLLVESGRHFNVTVGSDANHDGNPLTDRPLTVGRNTFVGQSLLQLDLSVGSSIRLTENQRLRLSVQIFNVLNRTNFASYNTVLGQPHLSGLDPNIVFGSSRLSGIDFRQPLTPSGFGLGTSTFDPRRLQFEVRYQF